jgi:hypothetical protein
MIMFCLYIPIVRGCMKNLLTKTYSPFENKHIDIDAYFNWKYLFGFELNFYSAATRFSYLSICLFGLSCSIDFYDNRTWSEELGRYMTEEERDAAWKELSKLLDDEYSEIKFK